MKTQRFGIEETSKIRHAKKKNVSALSECIFTLDVGGPHQNASSSLSNQSNRVISNEIIEAYQNTNNANILIK